ncbi:MAG TPA: MerR family transcriptional regulator [Beijerinckiaceae bacterium]|nr:MerR family transcriptional regulator [Beijerinckiaceae bacterium]
MRAMSQSSAFSTSAVRTAATPTASPAPEAREWTISDMSRHFGLTLRALRFYESKGLIKPNRFGGARYYTARDRVRLNLILTAKQMGFTLTETAALIGKLGDDESAELPLTSKTVQTQIAFLEDQRSAIDRALNQLYARRDGQASA